jgi:hypothetical protein
MSRAGFIFAIAMLAAYRLAIDNFVLQRMTGDGRYPGFSIPSGLRPARAFELADKMPGSSFG